MTLKQIFKVNFIIIVKYLPAISESHLPTRSLPNSVVYIERRLRFYVIVLA
jgi:hypothetical protein